MTKEELLVMLEPLADDIEIWMEVDAGVARIGSAYYEPNGIDADDDCACLVVAPANR